MNLIMSGLDYQRAPIALREAFSFTRSQAGGLCTRIAARPQVLGCVLLNTCNRTEVYCSLAPGAQADPARLLCTAVGVEPPPEGAFRTLSGEEAARHLMEVAGGFQSQIWGDDQILTQVKQALTLAREQQAADPVLETLFREAAAAGKAVKSQVPVSHAPPSAARRAVEVLEQAAGGLAGKRALVIGNGAMGRLSAQLLREAGCQVTVTLRSYHHGETLVPAGCAVVPYEDRYQAVAGADLLVSATASPHSTITASQLGPACPPLMADLALPRDIDPAVGERPGVRLFNMDDLGVSPQRSVPAGAQAIIARRLANFRRWDSRRGQQSPGRFPLFVDLTGRRAVIVGGGTVAGRRAGVLRAFGAQVTLIAPRWDHPLEGVEYLARPYAAGDLAGAFLAVAATDDRAVNRAVGAEARALGIPVSVADCPEECTFFFPAVCTGGGVTAGEVSGGTAHHRTARAARAIRALLEEMEGDDEDHSCGQP